MNAPVNLETVGDIAVIRIDDGKANALGHTVMDQINTALDTALGEGGARAVVLFGRPGKFSAGFDLSVMKDGPEAAQEMVRKGAELCLRLYGAPVPVIAGSDGHALAAGALVLLSCDVRIASDTPGKVGLPETTIGMPLPVFGTELARDRLSPRHFTAATLLGTIYSPTEAIEVGYVDAVVAAADHEDAVMARATGLAEALSPSGFAATVVNARAASIANIRATLDADLSTFGVATD